MKKSVTFNGVDFVRYSGSSYASVRNYYYPRYKRDYCRGIETLHREVWKFYRGPIPPRHHIHHIDNDHDNNDITNLECLEGRFHVSLHAIRHPSSHAHMIEMGLKSKAWHSSPEGKAWHSRHVIEAAEKRRQKRLNACVLYS